jgi:hypothetical protein
MVQRHSDGTRSPASPGIPNRNIRRPSRPPAAMALQRPPLSRAPARRDGGQSGREIGHRLVGRPGRGSGVRRRRRRRQLAGTRKNNGLQALTYPSSRSGSLDDHAAQRRYGRRGIHPRVDAVADVAARVDVLDDAEADLPSAVRCSLMSVSLGRFGVADEIDWVEYSPAPRLHRFGHEAVSLRASPTAASLTGQQSMTSVLGCTTGNDARWAFRSRRASARDPGRL